MIFLSIKKFIGLYNSYKSGYYQQQVRWFDADGKNNISSIALFTLVGNTLRINKRESII